MASSMSQSTGDSVYLPSTQVRRLKPKARQGLIRLLNLNGGWQELACVILHPNRHDHLFTAIDISTMEQNPSPAEVLLDHWSTMGSKLPTLEDLLELLVEANLFRAAKFVSESILNVPSHITGDHGISTDEFELSQRGSEVHNISVSAENCSDILCNDSIGSCSAIDNSAESDHTIRANIPSSLNRLDSSKLEVQCDEHEKFVKRKSNDHRKERGALIAPLYEQLNVCKAVSYKYEDLAIVTNDFDYLPVHQGGHKLGEGAFGVVYLGCLGNLTMAVKKLKSEIDRQYLTELDVLTRYRHENLLPLFGYSTDGPHACLVYAYMVNGSLQERLACVGNTKPIPWLRRIEIALGTARGINHLHTFKEVPLVHRDIKSANILLDENWVPKVGDFGLVRIGDSSNTTTVLVTANVLGTSVYMAREAFRGDVSVKLDTFSYGVVLLELLTGLAPYDASREENDLISYMEERKEEEEIVEILDKKAGQWNVVVGLSLHDIAERCLEERKRTRPTMAEILPKLEKLHSDCFKDVAT